MAGYFRTPVMVHLELGGKVIVTDAHATMGYIFDGFEDTRAHLRLNICACPFRKNYGTIFFERFLSNFKIFFWENGRVLFFEMSLKCNRFDVYSPLAVM